MRICVGAAPNTKAREETASEPEPTGQTMIASDLFRSDRHASYRARRESAAKEKSEA
jgi:hypothetical protein